MAKVKTRERMDEIAGRLCKVLIPIRDEYYLGGGRQTAICTLSSLDLLHKISCLPELMGRIAIAGRLFSENKGIDAIINFHSLHPELQLIIICGKEVRGHKAGQALIALAKNGVDSTDRILGAQGPYPVLRSNIRDVSAFRRKVRILYHIGITDVGIINSLIPADPC